MAPMQWQTMAQKTAMASDAYAMASNGIMEEYYQ